MNAMPGADVLSLVGVALSVAVPGMVWAAPCPSISVSPAPFIWRMLRAWGLIILLGAVGLAFRALFLAYCNRLTIPFDILLTGVMTLAGLPLLPWGDADRMREWGRVSTGALLLTLLVTTAGLRWPMPSEWVLGGWDPGVYINQGICVARNGGFHLEPDPALSLLADDEIDAFVRHGVDYMEAYPGNPVRPDSRAYIHYFFRLYPAWIANLALHGGMPAALRVNYWTGLLGAAIALSLGLSWPNRRRTFAVAAVALWISHPIWLYHLHIPTTEVLQLLLVVGGGLTWLAAAACPALRWWQPPIFFLMVVNRYDSLPFGFIWLFFQCWADPCSDRPAIRRLRLLTGVALLAGAMFDIATAAVTLHRIRSALPLLHAVTVLAAFAWLVMEWWCCRRGKPAVAIPDRWLAWAGGGIAFAAAIGLWFASRKGWPPAVDFGRALPFLGAGLLLAAGLGIILALRSLRQPKGADGISWLMFLLLVSISVPIYSFMVQLYPYALRRYLPYTLPLLCFGAAELLTALRALRGGRVVSPVLLSLLIVVQLPQAWRSARAAEYTGVSSRLANIASKIPDSAITVVDHHWWGTPFTFIFGKPTLSGMKLYKEPPDARAMVALHRLAHEGRPIYWLTSTGDGLAIYPTPPEPVTLVAASGKFSFPEVIHHPRARTFECRTVTRDFKLYRWHEGSDAASDTVAP